MNRILAVVTNLFPVWVLIGGALALMRPAWFTWFGGGWITWGLAVIMLGMGITLTVEDCRRALKMPRAVGIGFAGQYLIMPFLGWSIAHLLKLETPFAVGLILVSCCPGGTASNVVAYLARANVALSVLMTTCSTIGAVVMTPMLTKWLAGQYVTVDALGLFVSTLKIVLAPVVIGVALNRYVPRAVKFVLPVAPLVSVLAIVMICASIIGSSADQLRQSGGVLLLAVFLLHVGGFGLGYLFSHLFQFDKLTSRTISIEVGMQNSGLGAALAKAHFSAMPLAPLPCALSATFHSVIGSLLAGYWRMRQPILPLEQNRNTAHTPMPKTERFNLVMKLAGGFHLLAEQRVRDVAIPLSVIIDVARASLDAGSFFPPNLRPEQLGDGAVIERRGKHHFRVHERFEIGQLRFSDISSRRCYTLRGAVLRYLKHYRPLLVIDRVQINRWK